MTTQALPQVRTPSAAIPITVGLAILLVLAMTWSVTLGRYNISMIDVWSILLHNIVPLPDHLWTDTEANVVQLVRLPRILAAVVIGAGLAVSGTALQGMFRNPLVDPGVIVSAFFEAAISIVKLLADPHEKLPQITYWLMGSIASTSYSDLLLLCISIIPAAAVIFLLRFQINILSLGEDKARALGTPIELVQWLILIAVSVISAAVVATSGIIGWVGLVIPHVGRALVGAEHRRLLPVSALIGALYMLLVDDVARTVTTSEIPIGIITALIGVPVFAVVLKRLQTSSGWTND